MRSPSPSPSEPAPSSAPSFRSLFETLTATTDAGDWWPARTRFEIIVGAVLVQNTNWRNVETSLARLDAAGMLEPQALAAASGAEIEELIRPSGFMRAKAASLQGLAAWFLEHDEEEANWSNAELRTRLLALRGVGEETADALLLYVYERPAFLFDAYARRVLAAAGFGAYPSYAAARKALNARVHAEGFTVAELAAFHGLIVAAGKKARDAGGWDNHWPHLEAAAGTALRPLREKDSPALETATLATMNWCGDRFTREDIRANPAFSHYTRMDASRGDFGVVAVAARAKSAAESAAEGTPEGAADTADEQVAGIAWALLLPESDRGYGWMGADVPEMSLWVASAQRGRGLGRRLLRALLAEADARGIARVSLSVEEGNPARDLYLREGFVPVAGREADGVMLRTAPAARS